MRLMSREGWIRTVILIGLVVVVEAYCRLGFISRLILIPPSDMLMGMVALLRSGAIARDIVTSLTAMVIAGSSAIAVGFLVGVGLHSLPRVRRVVDPVLTSYYSIPIFVFYPVFIVILGVNNLPKIAIAFLFGVVAMITNTMNGIDRVPTVLRKTGRVMRLSVIETNVRIVLPAAAPHLFNGVKFAVAYAVVGVIGAEFLLSSSGIGYQISYTFNSFDAVHMYAIILLVLVFVAIVNTFLLGSEKRLMRKRSAS